MYEYYSGRNKLFGDFAKLAMCVDDEDLFIQGDPSSWSAQAVLELDFEACVNSTENNFFCKSEEEIESWSDIVLSIVVDSEQVDLKNRTHPIQSYRELADATGQESTIELGPNEFSD